MRVGSVFSGYGGSELALASLWPDAHPVWFVENDKHAAAVLAARWPGVPNHGDVTTVDWTAVEPVDVLTGGFPCQDLSHAGKRLGLRPGTRSGLWEHMAYAIGQLRPPLVVIENVRGLLSADAHSDLERDCWCVGDTREAALRALGAVLGDLADLGYDARWGGLRAADAGAPHGRFRVFIAAYPDAVAGPPASARRHRDDPHRQLGAVGGTVRRDRAAANPESPASGHDAARPGPRIPRGADRAADGLALLPTPRAADGAKGGPGQVNGRGVADSLPGVAPQLLPTPAVNDMGCGKTPEQWDEWTDAMRVKHGNGNGHGPSLVVEAQRLTATDFGKYTVAVRRWERLLGRPVPPPTQPGVRSERVLSPRFTEWMMGLPDGWVTGVGIPTTAQHTALGNGIVPQQMALALRLLLDDALWGAA